MHIIANSYRLINHCKRPTPRQYTNFIATSRVVKIIRDQKSEILFEILKSICIEESRYPGAARIALVPVAIWK